jgi:hypothetical protein
MPGYLSNRYVSFDPALSSDLASVQSNLQASITAVEVRVTEAEGNIDDLSLNIGV